MSHPNFQRKAIAAAITSIIMGATVGTASALEVAPTETFPKSKGDVFLGGPSTQVRITSATATTDDLIEARIHYYDAAMTFISSTIPVADSNGAALTIDLTVNAPAGATQAVITVDTSMSGDDISGRGFGYILAGGGVTFDGGEADFEADQRDAAVAAGALHPIRPSYSEISVTDAKVDALGASNSIIYVTFNADPVGFDGMAVPATDFVNVVAGLSSVAKTVSDGTAGTVGEPLDENQKALLEETEGVGALLPPPGLTAFAGPIVSVANAVMLTDGAGNVPTAGNAITSITELGAPAYRPTGMVAIATGDPDDLHGDDGAGTVTVNIGLDAEPVAATWDAADDLVISDPAITPSAFMVGTDANGEDTILQVDLAPAPMQKFYFSTNPGELLMGTDREDAEANPPITVNVTDGVTPLALALNPTVSLDTNAMVGDDFLGAETVVAGVAQTPVVATRDSNLDGWIDGSTIDFLQDVDSLPTNLGLISYAGAPTMAISDRVELTTDAATFAAGSTSMVNIDLTTPDIPLPDGTAPPGNANNDYNGDGTEDDVDQALVVEENFNTGVDVTFASPGVPWEAMIGTNDLANPVTSGVYESVWDALTGGNLAVSTGNHLITVDGAAPVVQSVTYTEVIDAAAAEAMGVDRSGTVTIKASELVQVLDTIADAVNDTINEFLFDGVPSDLLNLAATIADQVAIIIDDLIGDMTIADSDEIMLTNMPRAALVDDVGGGAANAVLSLGSTGAATDVNGASLFIAAGAVASATIVEGAPAGPVLNGGSFVEVGGEWHVCAMFDQDLVAPAGQIPADLNAWMTIRALIGFDESTAGTSSSDLDGAEGPEDLAPGDEATAIFQFVMAGADVEVGSALCGGTDDKVLLTVPGGGLPADTVKIWIDSDPASMDEIADGSLKYLANADGVPNQDDDGHQFDDDFGQVADDDGNGIAVSDSRDVPVAYTLSGDPDGAEDGDFDVRDGADMFWPTINDEDTQMVDGNTAPFFNNNNLVGDDSRVLYTQNVRGTAVHDGVAYPEGTAIRADLVRVMPMSEGFTTPDKPASVGQGWIDIRQGSNSEYNTVCNCQLDSWLTVALLNDGAVTGDDFDRFNNLEASLAEAETALDIAQDNQQSFSAQQELVTARDKAENKLRKQFPSYSVFNQMMGSWNVQNGMLLFVEVTNGAGSRAADGTSRVVGTIVLASYRYQH